MVGVFLWMFATGGVSLLALVWLGGGADGAPDGSDADVGSSGGLVGEAAALLTVRGVLAAVTVAGAAGALVRGVLHLPTSVALAGAAFGGLLGAWLWRRVTRLFVAFDRNHAVSLDVLVGREGTLTVGIGGVQAPGIVQVVLSGVSQEFSAVSADGRAYPEGARVLIVRLLADRTVAVESSPYPALSPSP